MNLLKQLLEMIVEDDEGGGDDNVFKFVIVDEGPWENPNDNSSMLDIYEVTEGELRDLGYDHIEEVETDRTDDFIEALRNGNVGNKTDKKARVYTDNPDLGSEGVMGPDDCILLFPSL